MAIKEYKPGKAFPGRMGRTIGESEPVWPAPLRARVVSAQCSLSCSMTHASGSSAATACDPGHGGGDEGVAKAAMA